MYDGRYSYISRLFATTGAVKVRAIMIPGPEHMDVDKRARLLGTLLCCHSFARKRSPLIRGPGELNPVNRRIGSNARVDEPKFA
jgi:hypothetical protein